MHGPTSTLKAASYTTEQGDSQRSMLGSFQCLFTAPCSQSMVDVSSCLLFADGFITYDSHIPKHLLDNGGPRTNTMDINNTIGHFELMNHQLREVSCACVTNKCRQRHKISLHSMIASLVGSTPSLVYRLLSAWLSLRERNSVTSTLA